MKIPEDGPAAAFALILVLAVASAYLDLLWLAPSLLVFGGVVLGYMLGASTHE